MDKTSFCLKWTIIILKESEERTNNDYSILMKLQMKSADKVKNTWRRWWWKETGTKNEVKWVKIISRDRQ